MLDRPAFDTGPGGLGIDHRDPARINKTEKGKKTTKAGGRVTASRRGGRYDDDDDREDKEDRMPSDTRGGGVDAAMDARAGIPRRPERTTTTAHRRFGLGSAVPPPPDPGCERPPPRGDWTRAQRWTRHRPSPSRSFGHNRYDNRYGGGASARAGSSAAGTLRGSERADDASRGVDGP